MISLKNNKKGFTIVELLIVIVVIGILALLVVTTYGGIQSKARDTKRTSDIGTIQTQLEAFFSQSGYYPSNADMNGAAWLSTNMKSLDTGALADPSNTASKAVALVAASKTYAYAPLNAGGTSCEANDTTCASYTLTATYENTVNGSGTVIKKNLD